MAAYIFAEKIETGKPITVYNHGEMKRDFTFVGDVVDGLISVMEWRDTSGSPQVFNLGNNKPVELMRFVKVCCNDGLASVFVGVVRHVTAEHLQFVRRRFWKKP